MDRLHTLGLSILLAVATLASPQPASGQATSIDQLSADDRIRLVDVLHLADDARDAGDCDVAIAGYEQALEILDSGFVRLSIASCLEATGQVAEAAALLEAIVAAGGELAALGEDQLTALEVAHAALLTVRASPASAVVTIDGESFESLGAPLDFELLPGRYALTVSAEDHIEETQTVAFTYDEEQTVDVTLELTAPAPSELPPAEEAAAELPAPATGEPPVELGRRRLAVPLSLAGLAAGAFAGGTVFGARSASANRDLDNYDWTDDRASIDDYNAIGDDKADNGTRTNVLLGVGVGLAAASVVTLVTAPRRPAPDVDVAFAPTFGAATMGGRLDLRW